MHPNESIGASGDRQYLHEAAPLLPLVRQLADRDFGSLIRFYLVSRLL